MAHFITVESFGSEVPSNWEQVADFLNSIIEERGIEDDIHAVNDLWYQYWHGELEGSPEPESVVTVVNRSTGEAHTVEGEEAILLIKRDYGWYEVDEEGCWEFDDIDFGFLWDDLWEVADAVVDGAPIKDWGKY